MLERRLKEIDLLRKRYGELDHGANVEWVIFKSFRLPPGWNRTVTRLLIIVPPGYPMTPPDNFYVEPGLKLVSGAGVTNYSEPVSQLGQNWGQFSYHVDSGDWKATADILSGHNLLTFMLGVERRLSELN
jgi:hypothetical protein